jgi:hypothetical protein
MPLPSHVIEVSKDERTQPRLHVTTPGEKGHYLTLSHCWGAGVSLVLNGDNIHRLQQYIVATELSRNFQDAITLTRKLGFSYIWTDALSIVQDSPSDWAIESSMMAGVYSRCALMISALAAKDGTVGILRPRAILQSYPMGRHKKLVLQSPRLHPYFLWHGGPLATRAWAYQEKMLSQRIVHFGNEWMAWECRTQVYLEDTYPSPVQRYRSIFAAQDKAAVYMFLRTRQ